LERNTKDAAAVASFVDGISPEAGHVASKVMEAVNGVFKAMPGFKESPATAALGKEMAGILAKILSSGMDTAIKAPEELGNGDALAGLDALGGGAKAVAAAEAKKNKKAEFVGLADLNKRMQGALTGKENKAIALAEKNVKHAEKIEEGVGNAAGGIAQLVELGKKKVAGAFGV
jgi:hypothetical protein